MFHSILFPLFFGLVLCSSVQECRARPNSSIQNNIIVAKFSMQIRKISPFSHRRQRQHQSRKKYFHVNIFTANGLMEISFFTSKHKAVVVATKKKSPYAKIIFMRTLFFNCFYEKEFFFNVKAFFLYVLSLLRLVSIVACLYLAPNHQFDSISQSSDDLKRISFIGESILWVIKETRQFNWLYGCFITFFVLYFLALLIVLNEI